MLELTQNAERYIKQFEDHDYHISDFPDSAYILGIRLEHMTKDNYSLSYIMDIMDRSIHNFEDVKDEYFRYIIDSYVEIEYFKAYFGCLDSGLI